MVRSFARADAALHGETTTAAATIPGVFSFDEFRCLLADYCAARRRLFRFNDSRLDLVHLGIILRD